MTNLEQLWQIRDEIIAVRNDIGGKHDPKLNAVVRFLQLANEATMAATEQLKSVEDETQ